MNQDQRQKPKFKYYAEREKGRKKLAHLVGTVYLFLVRKSEYIFSNFGFSILALRSSSATPSALLFRNVSFFLGAHLKRVMIAVGSPRLRAPNVYATSVLLGWW